ncbi:MAG: 4-hydroxy-tetrahydrodipicolinate reductase [Synergistaceae bacterium]|nr:4-hydroxy-tetrahydrodipicolinate reductase [Synergistaceae bacterium]MDD2350875.1 4-hydroxy-tetrahydrodipicolinate reductase [Synergistaceae bacterium]MDD3672988.1 4-hydroxy-tetrahydrodipicolinate reductase [Synergistaceae bacterium]
MIKVFVSGASGNVGSTVIRTIQTTEGFELVGGWCLEGGEDLGVLAKIKTLGIVASGDMDKGLTEAKPDVVIDFSAATVLEENMKLYLKHGLNVVVGTTGLTDEQLDPYKKEVAAKGLRWAVIPNYGLGISLVSEFIKKAREFYPFVTITDQHTNEMANAPSGTAQALAKAASAGEMGEVRSKEVYNGVLGAKIEGVQVFSQRLPWPGPYSAHIITLARKDELIKISVEDHTSDIYMDGVFLTAGKIGKAPAGTFFRGLAEVMD